MKVSNGTYTHYGEQLCQITLKSIPNCRSYGPDINLTFKCDLGLGPTWTNTCISNGTSTCDREQSCDIILNPSTIVDIMSEQIPMQIHSHCDNNASLTSSGLVKNGWSAYRWKWILNWWISSIREKILAKQGIKPATPIFDSCSPSQTLKNAYLQIGSFPPLFHKAFSP